VSAVKEEKPLGIHQPSEEASHVTTNNKESDAGDVPFISEKHIIDGEKTDFGLGSPGERSKSEEPPVKQ
jgi:hypothetical protein